jgi:hypothetical protein
MEIKKEIFKRTPPGDRWLEIDGDQTRIFPSLTDALEHYFQKTGIKQYYVDAGAGYIYRITHEKDPEPIIPQFSIYGEY